ncbi:cytochrome c oxidase assembly protein COX18, mitochondrial [Episyrphus balteatus]|uniref:cytochrome c oxidase assembly protein COX18, mitochondrial n=1 Tax=Episyrphus balteatus TaxID=286459 RepID=UPI0024859548|nr:cytochrome c oxidase assembly protein COX18, mitochondrial [Episyrphus balteatus]
MKYQMLWLGKHAGVALKGRHSFSIATRSFSCLHKRDNEPKKTSPWLLHTTHRQIATEPTGLAGFWQTLSNSTPVAYMQQGLVEIHDFTGLPWWATIVLSTFVFRTLVTLPLTIYSNKIMARIELITLEMPALVAELKQEAAVAMKKFKWTEAQTRRVYNHSLKKQWNQLIVRENCHPAKTLIVLWGQIPLWVFQSVALRNLVYMLPNPNSLDAQLVFTELTLGGFGWIPNLTEVDSSYILPVALGIINLSIIEMQQMVKTRPAGKFQAIFTNVFRVLSVAMVPIACTVPSALCVYWTASSSYGLLQNLLLLSPKFRRAVRIPQTQTELQNPYQHLWMSIKARTGNGPAPVLPKINNNETQKK